MFLKSININNQYVKFKLPFLKEGYLIRWNKLSKTDIHHHNNKQCDFILLNGELLECIYKKKSINSLDTIRKIDKLKKYSINDTIGYHQIFNLDKKIKWSIHNYY
jgi:hypothetical protein